MKLYLEEETEKEGEKTISKIKEVTKKADAIKDKTANKCYLHTCYHDTPDMHSNCRPCKREVI